MPFSVEVRTSSSMPISIRLEGRLEEAQRVFVASLAHSLQHELRSYATPELQRAVPVRTGNLRRYIRVFMRPGRGAIAIYVRAAFYVVSMPNRAAVRAWVQRRMAQHLRRSIQTAARITQRQLG